MMRLFRPKSSLLLLSLLLLSTHNTDVANGLRILLTNNDGIDHIGLQTLKTALQETDQHDVFVYAPRQEFTGPGAALTLPFLNTTQVAPQEFAVEGFASSCVLLGLTEVTDIDLVISGPSPGFTSGGQDLHSGTLAAALTAISKNVPAFAILSDASGATSSSASSSGSGSSGNTTTDTLTTSMYFGNVARFVVQLVDTLAEELPKFPNHVGLKIGYPSIALPSNQIRGVALAANNNFSPVTFTYTMDNGGEEGGGSPQQLVAQAIAVEDTTTDPASDYSLLQNGFIAALAIQNDISVKTTHYNGFFLGGLALKLEGISVQ
mgnify:CR=1 FL=1